jgi:hypothetical protein
MRRRFGALALPIFALGALAFAGCGGANEENLGGETSKVVPPKAGAPDFKSYGEAMLHQAEQAKKGAKVGAPRKSQQKPAPEQPKTK